MTKIMRQKDYMGNTVLHLLSQRPLTDPYDTKLTLIMGFLFRGARPHEENDLGQTFLETSPIKERLCSKISEASDEWIIEQLKNEDMMESWICLQDDIILQTIFRRLGAAKKLSYDLDPILIGNKIWMHRQKIPLSYQEFLALVAKFYNFDDDRVKESCKERLDPGIALPFYRDLKDFTLKPPSHGFYIKKLLQTTLCLSLILRFIDAVTDLSLIHI